VHRARLRELGFVDSGGIAASDGSRFGHTRVVAGKEGSRRAPDEGEIGSGVRVSDGGGGDVRDPLPREIRDPSFPASVRGYDRRAVDAYVERVNRLIAELQMSGSPRAAVRHALDRVGEQTSGILQRARETAEEITTSAREEAGDTTVRARAEAQDLTANARREASDALAGARAEAEEIVAGATAEADEILTRARDQSEQVVARARIESDARARQVEEEIAAAREQAEAQMRSLQAEIAAISDERRTLLEEVRGIAARLDELVAHAEPPQKPTPSQRPESGPADKTVAAAPAGPNGDETQVGSSARAGALAPGA
jgi:DivIVA domain-containing protein